MATSTERDIERLQAAGLWTTDPTSYPDLRPQTRVGEAIEIGAVPMEYHTRKTQLVFCCVCGRANHNHGFVVELLDKTAVLVGNCCAGKLVDQATLIHARKQFERRKAALHYEGASAAIVKLLPSLKAVVDAYGPFCVGADRRLATLREKAPREMRALTDNARIHGERLVTTERVSNPAYSQNGRGPKFIYVDRPVGLLRGASLLQGGRLESLRYAIARYLESLIRVTDSSKQRPDAQRLTARFRQEVEEPAQRLDALANAASSFLTSENLDQADKWLLQEQSTGAFRRSGPKPRNEFKSAVEQALAISLPAFKPRLSALIRAGLSDT